MTPTTLTLFNREVDSLSLQVEGDLSDDGEGSDGLGFSYAQFVDGTELDADDLYQLTEKYQHLLYDLFLTQLVMGEYIL